MKHEYLVLDCIRNLKTLINECDTSTLEQYDREEQKGKKNHKQFYFASAKRGGKKRT